MQNVFKGLNFANILLDSEKLQASVCKNSVGQ